MPSCIQGRCLRLIHGIVVAASLLCPLSGVAAELRIGIIGTDSSHAVEFTRILNDAKAADHVDGARVVAAYRGGNPDFPLSRDRIDAFTNQLRRQWNLPFVETIRDLCPRVDGLLLLSVDPDSRESEFKEAAVCNKPIFVDKPFAPSLHAAEAMEQFAEQHKVTWFSSSALRFEVQQLRARDLRGADVWGPGSLDEHYSLDLSWYAIHSIEMLYAVMGAGVQTVSRVHSADGDIVTGIWADGRMGSVHVVRPDMKFGIVVFHASGEDEVKGSVPIDYTPLLRAIVAFVRTGDAPVEARETLEIFRFMDAAQQSMQHSGAVVRIGQP